MSREHSLIGLAMALPSHTTTPRTKAWRALKAIGAAVLRDGVYVLPTSVDHEEKLQVIAADIEAADGTAELLSLHPRDEGQSARFAALFDRGLEFAELITQLTTLANDTTADAPTLERRLRTHRRQYEQLVSIDFYPGEAQAQAGRAMAVCEDRLARMVSPGEPRSIEQPIDRLDRDAHRGRVWATRARPWADRLASAWLISRHVDPDARFVWLEQAAKCPRNALGFDFDGATFSHVGGRVTFEMLLASFGLDERPELVRLGALIHCLDVGGVPVPEAAGLSAVLAGLCRRHENDDQLLAAAVPVFDALQSHFTLDT